jgi:hypothetical protein
MSLSLVIIGVIGLSDYRTKCRIQGNLGRDIVRIEERCPKPRGRFFLFGDMRPMKEVHSYIASKAVQLSVRVAWLWGILCREADAESSSRVQVEAKLGTCGGSL